MGKTKMKPTIMFSLLFSFLLFSCASRIVEKPAPVYQTCRTPDVPEPQYRKPDLQNPIQTLLDLHYNFQLCLQYADMLRKANEVCK